MSHSQIKNRWTLLLEEKLRKEEPLLDLTLSNPTRGGFDYPSEQIREALALPEVLLYQPSPRGSRSARQAVCSYYSERGVEILPEQILLTASTSEAYSFLFKLFCDPGQNVLVPQPSYPLFDFLLRAESVGARSYPLGYQAGKGWQIDLDGLRAAIDSRTRGILVVSPNNPTGSFCTREEWQALLETAHSHGLFLVCDEVFADYPMDTDPIFDGLAFTLKQSPPVPVFFLNGLSKSAGLPQVKAAWMVGACQQVREEETWERLELIADTFLSVSASAQAALPLLLECGREVREQIRRRTRENYRRAGSLLNGTALEQLISQGGWYSVLRLPRLRSEEDWAIHLLERRVLVHPGYFYDFPEEAYLVVSLLPPPEVLDEGLSILLEACRWEG